MFGLLTCWLKYHAVLVSEELVNSTAIIDHSNILKQYMKVLILSVLHVPPSKHSTENGVIYNCRKIVILERKQILCVHTCIHSTVDLGLYMIIWNRLLTGGFKYNKKPLQAFVFSLFTLVSSQSQSLYTIESIIEIKQILRFQMIGSKAWLRQYLS